MKKKIKNKKNPTIAMGLHSQQTNLGSVLGTLVFGSQNVPRTFP